MKKEIGRILVQARYLYMSASGPLLLFKSLRRLNSIQILASKYSADKLMNLYSKTIKNESVDELCLNYIILVALSFKQDRKARKYLMSLSEEKYVWAKEMVKLALSTFVSLQVESIEQEPEIQRKPMRRTVADSTTQINIDIKDKENEN